MIISQELDVTVAFLLTNDKTASREMMFHGTGTAQSCQINTTDYIQIRLPDNKKTRPGPQGTMHG